MAEKKVSVDLDMRKSSRYKMNSKYDHGSDVTIKNSEAVQALAHCFDFSPTGMRFVIKSVDLTWVKLQDPITLSFSVPLSRDILEVKCVVVRIEESKFEGAKAIILAVEYISISDEAKEVLENFVEISAMTQRMESLIKSQSSWKDLLGERTVWFGVIAVTFVAVIAFFFGQSMKDLDKINLRVPANVNQSK